MIAAHGVEQIRRVERATMAALADGALMQRAAAGLARVLAGELTAHTGGVYGRRAVLLVGPGSNGGDALWAGARLARRGVRVDALLVVPHGHAEGLAGLLAAGGRVLAAADGPEQLDAAGRLLAAADLVVDGVLGIGGRPGLPPVAATLADELAGELAGVPVVAVDLPSGVDPDTGETPGPFLRADVTVTFGAVKACLLLPPANAAAGDVVVVDIGLDPVALGAARVTRLEPADVVGRWPVPLVDDDKYSRGVLGVVAGGATYTGAAVLCSGGAVRAGAGMVRFVGPAAVTDLVRARWPEVVPGPGRVQAWVVGPGVDPADGDQRRCAEQAMTGDRPCVVDAGALEVLADHLVSRPGGDLARARRTAPTLLTPHAGELARLLTRIQDEPTSRADVEASPCAHAARAARLTGATVLLKGATTLLVGPDGRVRAQPDGPHWLATAGSGDVLAGIAGALLAAGLEPLEAGSLAVVVHGTAGHLASNGGPVSAGTLLDAVQPAVAALLRRGGAGALSD